MEVFVVSIGITYVLMGPRDLLVLKKSISIIRKFDTDIDIKIYHDIDLNFSEFESLNVRFRKFDRISYPIREENRNSSYWRLVSLLESDHDCTLYLDNDIFVVHKGFFEGFRIAKEYGTAMVQNPRMFIATYEKDMGDADIGNDVLQYDKEFIKDMPKYMTSYNMGVMFSSKDDKSFIEKIRDEQISNPSRGQAGLYRTIWKTKRAPYCLPINWLVCKKHEGIERPLALHVGHRNILNWWNRSFNK